MRTVSKMMRPSVVVLGALLALPALALAETQPATPAPAAAAPAKAAATDAQPVRLGVVCKTDIQTLCAGIDPKAGGRQRCLRANEAKLSPDCAKAVAAKPAGWGQPTAAAAPAAAPEKK